MFFKYMNVRFFSTIYAVSSGLVKCGVSVIRVSGENAYLSIQLMTKPNLMPKSRFASLRQICHPISGEQLDRGLVLWFPGPKSFTGEDSVEFHIHGGPAVVKSVLTALNQLKGFSPAHPGDFTKRAFYNSKLDLTKVEGLGDLIHAETEAQQKQALRQMEGSLSNCYSQWRSSLLKCRAYLEAFIDFSEDENIEEGILLEVSESLKNLITEMKTHLKDSRRGERTKSGLDLVILGKPNVGKSTFLNDIVQKPAAIVSPIAGTTRDLVELCIDVGGFPVNICDTAGLRTTDDLVEQEGVRRAINKVINADISVVMIDANDFVVALSQPNFCINNFLENYLMDVQIILNNNKFDIEWLSQQNYILFINKIDTLSSQNYKLIKKKIDSVGMKVIILGSLLNGEGLEDALQELTRLCSSMCASGSSSEPPYLTSTRHRNLIELSLSHLLIISEELSLQTDKGNFEIQEQNLLLIAQQLQIAAKQVGFVTGHITTEDVLDHIFSKFCIGK